MSLTSFPTRFRFHVFSIGIWVSLAFLPTQAIQQDHVLYNMKNSVRIAAGSCSLDSPEIFFYEVAYPSLSLLYLKSKAFFGTLMDQIESSSFTDSHNEAENKTREQWEFITDTVKLSLDSAIDRVETSWNYFIISYETQPLPWEMRYKFSVISDAIYQLEYSYSMIDAVIRSGTKEIVGILKHQLTSVIRKLEEEIAKRSGKNDEVTEQKLFQQMRQALAKMKSSFSTKLLEKVVSRAVDKYHNSESKKTTTDASKGETFISEAMDQIAILFHAYREKGADYPNFWQDMAKIFAREFNISNEIDENEIIVNFMRGLSYEDNLIQLIVTMISRDSNK